MRRKLSRREIDRLENLLILLLVCLALFLIHRTGMFQSVTEQGSGTGDESLFAGVQDTALSRGTPVRLMVQNGTGRYGVQYDQTTVNRLYHDGLNDLLTQSLDTMATTRRQGITIWPNCERPVWFCRLCWRTWSPTEASLPLRIPRWRIPWPPI